MNQLITFFLCACCGVSPAAQELSGTPPEAPAGKPFIYKTSAGKPRKMEIFFPPNHEPAKTKVPGMILFHGGGWSGGSLDQFRTACACFASRGLVCATAEYQIQQGTMAHCDPHRGGPVPCEARPAHRRADPDDAGGWRKIAARAVRTARC